MDNIFDNYSKKPKVHAIKGDFIDRLHGSITISFLFLILILIMFRQALYSNIVCWSPTSFSGSQVLYAHQFCWINSTYHYPSTNEPDEFTRDNRVTIGYYQFILFILVGQILCFYIPSLIWRIIAANFNGYINKLMDIVSSKPKVSEKVTQEFLTMFKPLTKKPKKHSHDKDYESESSESSEAVSIQEKSKSEYFDERVLSPIKEESEADFEKSGLHQRQISNMSSSKLGKNGHKQYKFSPSFRERFMKQKLVIALNPLKGVKGLTVKYFLLKCFNLLNAIAQLFILNHIFGGKFWDYGYKYATKLMRARNPLLFTREFPIFTLCDFYTHQPNKQIHYNTLQCILTINVLLEKFYVLIWFWLIILSIVTFWNLLSWIYEIVFSSKAAFLQKYLTIQHNMRKGGISEQSSSSENNETSEKRKLLSNNASILDINEIEEFQNRYLGRDGLVMLLIVKSVAGDVAFIELLGVLWKDFRNPQEEKKLEGEKNQQETNAQKVVDLVRNVKHENDDLPPPPLSPIPQQQPTNRNTKDKLSSPETQTDV